MQGILQKFRNKISLKLSASAISTKNIKIHDPFGLLESLCLTSSILESIQTSIIQLLYQGIVPENRKISIHVKNFHGIGFTKQNGIFREIYLSQKYVKDHSRDEILGVIAHEMTHAWQYNGFGSLPAGITEGIADFIRLKLGLAAEHWKKEFVNKQWDQGYETTAFFFEYLDSLFPNIISNLNLYLKNHSYNHNWFNNYTGENIHQLWQNYTKK